jgi:hypothetical protein
MWVILRMMTCFIAAIMGVIALAESNLEDILNKAEKLFALRDRIVCDYSAWAPEYAKEDTSAAKERAKHCKSFCERFNIKAAPPIIRKNRKGLQIQLVVVRDIFRNNPEGTNTKTLLEISSGQLHAGPDRVSIENESSRTNMAPSRVLAKHMQDSGSDLAFYLGFFVIPSRKYVNLGKGTPQYYAGVNLSELVQKHSSPECELKIEEILVFETLQKKYALVQNLGPYKSEILLAVVYQPDGNAIFEFDDISKPRAWQMFQKDTDLNPQDVAKIRLSFYRDNFFDDAVRALITPLKGAAENIQLSKAQQQRLSEIKIRLGLDK